MTARVAIIHDWLTGMRGGERILEAVCARYPEADLFTLLHLPGQVSANIEQHRITTSFAQRLPGLTSFYRHYLPLFPRAIESFDLRRYQLVISLSHCVAHGVLVPPEAVHVCYSFTPMRYIWDQYSAYFSQNSNPLIRLAASLQAPRLRVWDQLAAQRVDAYATSSRFVARRIHRYYHRQARVIPPGIDLTKYTPHPTGENGGYYLIVSALSPYKKLDLAIKACVRTGRKLVIIGWGPEQRRLRKMSGPTVTFLGRVPDETVIDYYRRCIALLFPGEEDFGLTPLEVQACGRPVVAFAAGGCLETVIPGQTGILFAEQTEDALIAAMDLAERTAFDSGRIREQARLFDINGFTHAFQQFIDQATMSNERTGRMNASADTWRSASETA